MLPKILLGGIMIRTANLRWKTVIIFITLFFMFFISMESLAHARAGGGRSMGSRGFSTGSGSRTYQGSTTRPTQPTQQPGMTQPTPVQPSSPGMGRGFLSGLGGGLLGGMIGSMLFGGRASAAGKGGEGFGFGDLIIILIILAIVFFVIKRFRARKAMEMSSAGLRMHPLLILIVSPHRTRIMMNHRPVMGSLHRVCATLEKWIRPSMRPALKKQRRIVFSKFKAHGQKEI